VKSRLTEEKLTARAASPHIKRKELTDEDIDEIEVVSQKEAIKTAVIKGMRVFSSVETADIWQAIHEAHVYRKSGIDDIDIISQVVSAEQSWKKSSGHAFEEMVKSLGFAALNKDGIELILQRDLSALIKTNELANEPRDISWLREQIKSNIFDLYAILRNDGRRYCFGCIQSKTSIRDRVTRDREPSMRAMESYFWSVAVVLDGDFLKNPKFTAMVNGGTSEFQKNGWHGLYVFSELYSGDRIYPVGLDFKNFREHAIKAAKYWIEQRQWFNSTWKAD
jgi:hypothetical protein